MTLHWTQRPKIGLYLRISLSEWKDLLQMLNCSFNIRMYYEREFLKSSRFVWGKMRWKNHQSIEGMRICLFFFVPSGLLGLFLTIFWHFTVDKLWIIKWDKPLVAAEVLWVKPKPFLFCCGSPQGVSNLPDSDFENQQCLMSILFSTCYQPAWMRRQINHQTEHKQRKFLFFISVWVSSELSTSLHTAWTCLHMSPGSAAHKLFSHSEPAARESSSTSSIKQSKGRGVMGNHQWHADKCW